MIINNSNDALISVQVALIYLINAQLLISIVPGLANQATTRYASYSAHCHQGPRGSLLLPFKLYFSS